MRALRTQTSDVHDHATSRRLREVITPESSAMSPESCSVTSTAACRLLDVGHGHELQSITRLRGQQQKPPLLSLSSLLVLIVVMLATPPIAVSAQDVVYPNLDTPDPGCPCIVDILAHLNTTVRARQMTNTYGRGGHDRRVYIVYR